MENLDVIECQAIRRIMATHMHHWDKQAPQPESITEYLFATADYIASRNFIQTPILTKGQPVAFKLDIPEIDNGKGVLKYKDRE